MHQTTIANIQSDFISIFAALDSWCDERELCLLDTAGDSEARKAFIMVLVMNEHVLSQQALAVQTPAPEWKNHPEALWSVDHLIVPSPYLEALIDKFGSMSKNELRNTIRQQLFTIFCHLENVEDFQLAVSMSGHIMHVKGIEGLKLILQCMLRHIREHEEMLSDFQA
jgi:hypothetical protein